VTKLAQTLKLRRAVEVPSIAGVLIDILTECLQNRSLDCYCYTIQLCGFLLMWILQYVVDLCQLLSDGLVFLPEKCVSFYH
jgi:hypothetical protein